MVVPSTRNLLNRLTALSQVNLDRRELMFRQILDETIPEIFWGATPTKVDLVPFLEPMLPRRQYKIEFATEPKPGVPKQLLINVDFGANVRDGGIWVSHNFPGENNSNFDHGARIQELARSKVRHRVPRVFRVGMAKTTNFTIDYIVTQYIPDTVSLDKVWSSLNPRNKGKILDDLAEFLESLHEVNMTSLRATKWLSALDLSGAANYTADHVDYHPAATNPIFATDADNHTSVCDCGHAYHDNLRLKYFRVLLEKFDFDSRNRNFPKMSSFELLGDGSDGGFTVTSADNQDATHLNPSLIEFPAAELKKLSNNLRICHMDLEPRNILVKPIIATRGRPAALGEYRLIAITSWEHAVCAPFAYERGVKDGMLGCQFNYDYSWYKLFVEHTKRLIPEDEVHDKYIRAALDIKIRNRERAFDQPNPEHQARWFQREKLVMGAKYRDGYVRAEGAEDHKSPSETAYRNMGDKIVQRLIMRWMAHAVAFHGLVLPPTINDDEEAGSETDHADTDTSDESEEDTADEYHSDTFDD
ncbi:hypothetical protein CkaCkLH20_09123 [Colletotrichum karsti]|uniref:Protein kinase domain-containing protein n=1 Tax=Colletotrichum karsti TaxID=1095194 RepID=A0A9P6I799_9PEZI|nr:uncharacterized protein CkaCkLH20_09123 [Colletotrichum karsti]KAF9873310.1 hypothetical protein CkaCkLH20_09123 [Colletotrichum karsti]